MRKGTEGIVATTRKVEGDRPFANLGLDCDNGRKFLNGYLVPYFQDSPRQVGFTRSRTCPQQNTGHAEKKNWIRLHRLLEYKRIADHTLRARAT